MSRKVKYLAPELAYLAGLFVKECEHASIHVKIIQTLRSPVDQAKKFRCTRSLAEIIDRADRLSEAGRPDLASILLGAGPQKRPAWLKRGHLTMAACGESKHARLKLPRFEKAYACAFDFGCFNPDGSYIPDGNHSDYKIAGALAESLGLEWLGNNRGFKESAHVQIAGLPNTSERLQMVVI